MPKEIPKEILWLPDVAEHNYPAAESYLSLLHPEPRVAALIAALQGAPIQKFKAKDLFRASALSLLGVSNFRVDADLRKIDKGVNLSPLLLVRDEAMGKVVIADGYHRLCAVYRLNEDAWIPCKIV